MLKDWKITLVHPLFFRNILMPNQIFSHVSPVRLNQNNSLAPLPKRIPGAEHGDDIPASLAATPPGGCPTTLFIPQPS